MWSVRVSDCRSHYVLKAEESPDGEYHGYVGDDGCVAFLPDIANDGHKETAVEAIDRFIRACPEANDIHGILTRLTEYGKLVRLNDARIVKAGDIFVDADTGEFIADAHWGFNSTIKTHEDVVAFMSRVQASDAVYAAHLRQKVEVIRAMDEVLKRDQRRRAYYAQWFSKLREWAANNKPKGKQTVDTPWGKIAFRKPSFDTKVVLREPDITTDKRTIEALAVAWCEEHEAFSAAVKVEKSILSTPLQVAAKDNPQQYLPQDIFAFQRGVETCTIDTGFGPDVNHKVETGEQVLFAPPAPEKTLPPPINPVPTTEGEGLPVDDLDEYWVAQCGEALFGAGSSD